jgi:hypothetical protein
MEQVAETSALAAQALAVLDSMERWQTAALLALTVVQPLLVLGSAVEAAAVFQTEPQATAATAILAAAEAAAVLLREPQAMSRQAMVALVAVAMSSSSQSKENQ